MKIRNGFVSNSSSSSFTCVLTKDDYNKALQSLSSETKKYVELADDPKEQNINGVDLVLSYGDTRDNPSLNGYYYDSYDCESICYNNESNIADAIYDFVQSLKKYTCLYNEVNA